MLRLNYQFGEYKCFHSWTFHFPSWLQPLRSLNHEYMLSRRRCKKSLFGWERKAQSNQKFAKYIRRLAVDRNESDIAIERAEEMSIIYSMEGIHSLKTSKLPGTIYLSGELCRSFSARASAWLSTRGVFVVVHGTLYISRFSKAMFSGIDSRLKIATIICSGSTVMYLLLPLAWFVVLKLAL